MSGRREPQSRDGPAEPIGSTFVSFPCGWNAIHLLRSAPPRMPLMVELGRAWRDVLSVSELPHFASASLKVPQASIGDSVKVPEKFFRKIAFHREATPLWGRNRFWTRF